MEKVIPIDNHANWRQNYHYSVYEYKLVAPDGTLYSRCFIVLKNQYSVIVHFTRWHRFVGIYEEKVVHPISENNKNKMRYVCKVLNYILLEHYEIYGIDHVFKVTKDMLITFFVDYSMSEKKFGGFRGNQSIEKCISAVVSFFDKLARKYGSLISIKRNELYTKRMVIRKGRQIEVQKPDFTVYALPQEQKIFRDIPTKVFQILLNLAVRYMPDIAFAIAIQAFAGLRPGEACNVRQIDSPLGKGITFTFIEGRLIKAEIDLSHEYVLRSDGILTGGIKKERKQCVYPAFFNVFYQMYKLHALYLASQEYETDYRPMFLNKQGMALTYHSYIARFHELVERYLRPALMKHPDAECRIYGQKLYENTLGPHALRHYVECF